MYDASMNDASVYDASMNDASSYNGIGGHGDGWGRGLDNGHGHGGTGHLAWVVGAKDEVKQAQRAAN